MSEFTQVDLQIGTEAQFETKKATLSEGVIVGLTDPIHESELDSDLQTKLNAGAQIYKHNLSIPCVLGGDIAEIYTVKVNIISASSTEYTFNTFCAELVNGNSKMILPCFALTPSGSSFTTGAVFVYDIIADYTEEIYGLTVKVLLFEDFDGALQPERELTGSAEIGDVAFSDTVIQL